MSDIDVTPGTGKTVKTDTVSGKEYQVMKIDAGGAGVSVPIVAGRQADAASIPVALSSEDVALVGALTETAPTTDTASSGLNGRLQRIAQRITSLIALLPTALGSGGGLKVDGSGTALPVSGTVAISTSLALDATVTTTNTEIGATNETAPGTDTATVGLNGRLQRIAQRITSLIALLPTALGANGGLKVEGVASGTAVPISVANGSNVVEGTTTDAAVITDATGTIQQYLRGLIKQWIAGTLTFASQGYAARISVTRPSDTTTYGAGDVVGVTGGGTACITFPNMGAGAGEYMITSARFQRNATALISGETSYTLHLFNIAQPAAQIDNAVFDVAAGDQASYLGSINLGTPVDLGSTLAIEQNGINKQVTLASSSLFGVLVTVGGYTPVSAAVHVVELHSVKM